MTQWGAVPASASIEQHIGWRGALASPAQDATQTLTANTDTAVVLRTRRFDPALWINVSSSNTTLGGNTHRPDSFMPQVAGWYMLLLGVAITTPTTAGRIVLGVHQGIADGTWTRQVVQRIDTVIDAGVTYHRALHAMYFNGSTDWARLGVEVNQSNWVIQGGTSAQEGRATFFGGVLMEAF